MRIVKVLSSNRYRIQVIDSSNIVKVAEVGGQVVLIKEADLAELAEFVPTARAMEVEAFAKGGRSARCPCPASASSWCPTTRSRAAPSPTVCWPTRCAAGSVSLDARSLDTKNKKRDEHLRSADSSARTTIPASGLESKVRGHPVRAI